MNIGLPLPHFESEGFENSYRQHHEGTADNADAYGFVMSFIHTVSKGNKKRKKRKMKSEKFASARHFMSISSHIYARLSQTYAEYPRNLEG
jgi:hypothetical protein